MFSSGHLFNFSASTQNRYCILPSANRAIGCVIFLSYVNAVSNKSNHSAAGPRDKEPKRVSSNTVCILFLFVTGLMPKQKPLFSSNMQMNALRSSPESIPIIFSSAELGNATVFAFCYLTNLTVPSLWSICALCTSIRFNLSSLLSSPINFPISPWFC